MFLIKQLIEKGDQNKTKKTYLKKNRFVDVHKISDLAEKYQKRVGLQKAQQRG